MLAAVLFSAGVAKLGDPNALAEVIANYRVLPDALVIALAGILPVAEILVALALVAGPCVQGAGLVGAAMLTGFAGAMAQAKLRGIDLECGCFGASVHAQVSWGKVALNVAFAGLAAWVAWIRPVRWRDLLARPTLPLAGCAATAVLAVALSSHASVVVALDLAALVAKSDHIVVGVGGPQAARWSDDGRLILTDMQLRVEESWKGTSRAGDVLVITRLGGKLRDVALQVPGEANFAPDQRVVAFLHAQGTSRELRVVGMAQGVITVQGTGTDAMALPNGGGMALVGSTVEGALTAARAAVAQPTPFHDFRAEILRLAARGRP